MVKSKELTIAFKNLGDTCRSCNTTGRLQIQLYMYNVDTRTCTEQLTLLNASTPRLEIAVPSRACSVASLPRLGRKRAPRCCWSRGHGFFTAINRI